MAVPAFRRLYLNGFMMQKTRAAFRGDSPGLRYGTQGSVTRSWARDPVANKCRCLALFADDEKRGRARRRLVSSTIRDESARGDPGSAPLPQRHVLRSIGRPSGRKTHRRVRLAHASGERNRFGASAGPLRHGGVHIRIFLSSPRGSTSQHWKPFAEPCVSCSILFPFMCYVRNAVARRYSQIDAVSRLSDV